MSIDIYSVIAIDEEPQTRMVGENGNETIGVFDSYQAAIKAVEKFKEDYVKIIVEHTVLQGESEQFYKNSKVIFEYFEPGWSYYV